MEEKMITISTSSFGTYSDEPLKILRDNEINYRLNPYARTLVPSELISLANDSVGLIAGVETIDKDTLLKLPKLKVISRCGSGLDNIDLVEAEKLGVIIYNIPTGPSRAVAELTVGSMLCLLRKISEMDHAVKSGIWSKKMGSLLHRKKIGIIGLGNIGKIVYDLLLSFYVQIGYYDTNLPAYEEIRRVLRFKNLIDLIRWADIITLHVPFTGQQLIGEKELLEMKGKWLLNLSRGELVDEQSLYKYLANGYLNGAVLDTFKNEPYEGPLKDLNNVILTPHVGSYALEARVNMEVDAVCNLLRGLTEQEYEH